MVFSSTVFLFIFLPIVFLCNLVSPPKVRNTVLLVFSLIFYAWGEPVYILIMLFSIAMNYGTAVQIVRQSKQTAKVYLAAGVIVNLAMLFVFKYANFFVDNLNMLTGLSWEIGAIGLPIGISFYTFQAISYIVDVYRSENKTKQRFFQTALYISLFPQLIAGPIVKYNDIYRQLQHRTITLEKVRQGIMRFSIGLFKKLVFANMMGEVADRVFALPNADLSAWIVWTGAIAYSIQIYFDFSAYSDMAIGLGKMFGFDIKENFNYPYIARSMNEFWKRWHISLTNWFREYVYFPLGGNRKGIARTYINISIVFLCTGFWHGAEWTFVVWGISHGIFMILERTRVIRWHEWKVKWPSRVYTLLLVTTTFLIFRAETIGQAFSMIRIMFTDFQFSASVWSLWARIMSPLAIIVLLLSIIACTPWPKTILQRMNLRTSNTFAWGMLENVGVLLILLLCMLVISTETYNPFIYFRF